MEVVASLSQCRTAAAQCGLFTYKSVPVIFEPRCMSILKLLYFSFFSSSFCTTFLSAGIATSTNMHVLSFLFLIILTGLFAVISLFVPLDYITSTATG